VLSVPFYHPLECLDGWEVSVLSAGLGFVYLQ